MDTSAADGARRATGSPSVPQAAAPTSKTDGETEPTSPSPDLSAATHNEPHDDDDDKAECRICLETDAVSALVRPCACSGTLSYAHLKCLKLWARERGSLTCEICKTPYRQELVPELEAEALAGRATQGLIIRRFDPGGARTGQGIPIRDGIPVPVDGPPRPDRPYRHFFVRMMLVGALLGAVVMVLLFLGMYAGDAAWAGILLRVIAFGIPFFIVLKAMQACWNLRRLRNEEAPGTRHDGAAQAV
jgi:hypothetical protein